MSSWLLTRALSISLPKLTHPVNAALALMLN